MDDLNLTKQDLINMAELAKAKNICLFVEVTIPGQEETEVIVNCPSSVDNKLKYYLEMYNDDLTSKRNKDIKIVQISAGDFEYELFDSYKNVDPDDVEGIE